MPVASFTTPPAIDEDGLADDDDALDLSSAHALAADAQPEAADAANEELVLGAETIVAQPPEPDTAAPFGRRVDPARRPLLLPLLPVRPPPTRVVSVGAGCRRAARRRNPPPSRR